MSDKYIELFTTKLVSPLAKASKADSVRMMSSFHDDTNIDIGVSTSTETVLQCKEIIT